LNTRKEVLNPENNLRIAMGNMSGDMDSIVGALGYAYHLTLTTGDIWTPIVNCSRLDLKLKHEIYTHLIDDCKLNIDNELLFWDDLLELTKSGREIKEIAIIDHNLIEKN